MPKLKTVINYLLLLFLFLLPWQTRWIYQPAMLNGGFWEYGTQSFYGTEILLWLIVILFLIDRFRHKEFWQKITNKDFFHSHRKRLVVVFLIFCFLAFLIWHSLSAEISYTFLLRLLGGFCLAAIITNQLSSRAEREISVGANQRTEISPCGRNDKAALVALWLGGVGQGILALIQFITQTVVVNKWLGVAAHTASDLGSFVVESGGGRWLRAHGAFGSPNILGGYLAIIFLIGLILYLPSSPRQKILVTLGQMFILLGLILSFSRGAWLTVASGVLTLIILLRSSRQAEKYYPLLPEEGRGVVGEEGSFVALRMTIKQIFFSILILTTVMIILKPLFLTRVEITGRLEEKSITERINQYQQFSRIFSKNKLFGVGPGAYTLTLYQQNKNLPAWHYQPVHSVYLLMLAELGIVGSFLVFLFSCFLVRVVWKNNPLFISVLIPILILGLFDHWLWSMYFGLVFTSVILGLHININKKSSLE